MAPISFTLSEDGIIVEAELVELAPKNWTGS